MSRLFHVLGVLFLAQILFVGLVHLFLAVQGKNSAESMAALHDMPVLGGFFPASEPEDPPLDAGERQQEDIEAQIPVGDEVYSFPREYPRETVEELVEAARSERERYERLREELEQDRDALRMMQKDLEERHGELLGRIRDVQAKADELIARELEVQSREDLLKGSSKKAVEALATSIEAMSETRGAETLVLMMGRPHGGKDLAATVLMTISKRQRGKILDSMKKSDAVELMEAFRRLSSTSASGSSDSQTGGSRTGG